jgi:hypothetical protein
MRNHEDATKVHVPYRWSYADAAARTAATGFVAADEGKVARQADDNSLWMLTVYTGPTWHQLTGSGSGGTFTTEQIQDILGAMGVNGVATTFVYNDGDGTFTFDLDVTNASLLEAIRDAIGLALTEGSGIDITVNDAGDTITLAITAAAPTDHDHTAGAGDGGVLTNDEHDGFSEYGEIATPANPAANKVRLYAKDDGGVSKLYYRDSAGTETAIVAGTVDATSVNAAGATMNSDARGITYQFGDGTNVITSSEEAQECWIPVAITITGWRARAKQSGSIVWALSFAASGSTSYTTITSAAGTTDADRPQLGSEQEEESDDVTGWQDVTIPANSWLRATVNGSPATVTRAQLAIKFTVD